MNAPQFTPGPWVWHSDFPTDVICSESRECSLATIDIGCGDKREQNANARLIAAAPDYDALADKCDAFLRSILTSDPASRLNIEANALIEEIRVVRAKARGEQ